MTAARDASARKPLERPWRVSVVIPCFNEEATIAAVVEKVRAVDLSHLGASVEVVVVDDCSTDGTRRELERIRDRIDRLVLKERNEGKGAAMRTGFATATGEAVLVQDADLEYDPREYGKLLEPIADGRADVVYGSRFRGGEAGRVLYFWHTVGNRMLTTLSNMTSDLNLTDMETCFKAMRRECVQGLVLKEDRFGFEPEITVRLARAGWRFYEVGIGYDGRTYAEGKKITWKDGIAAFWHILWYGLTVPKGRGGG
ncbi:MAG: Undecaprenyl-phosphate 4-deoxy-4-formamido-L-arabinose transferase [Planctomycetes bacterium]|nr:Undecaprenyl-phosphate 4-deoxy-4-formamido-L-arabinose transferase [Planctomycetota bacterium]